MLKGSNWSCIKMYIDANDYENYLSTLKDLVSINSIYTSETGILKGLQYCENALNSSLCNWKIWRDRKGNLICVNPELDKSKPCIFLSAHIDTVGADPSKWLSSSDPFSAIETDTHIIGRGVNDCKAGVAFMLLVANLISKNILNASNIGFLFSYREEGNQEKTSSEIGIQIGKEIPVSEVLNCILCLENTVSVCEKKNSIGLYNHEPSNLFIELQGYLADFREFLTEWPDWKPIAISPCKKVVQEAPFEEEDKTGGHSSSLDNKENVIFDYLFNKVKEHDVILGGDFVQTSVISNSIKIFSSKSNYKHRLILNLRSSDPINFIRERLKMFDYKEYYPFEYGKGSDRRHHALTQKVIEFIKPISLENISLSVMNNPGRSDASAIWARCDSRTRENLAILTIGPGTRSHVDNGIDRKTHGPDEGYHKDAGIVAINYLLLVISKLVIQNHSV